MVHDAAALLVDGAETVVPGVSGVEAPAFIFPNHGGPVCCLASLCQMSADDVYAKLVLDAASLAFAKKHLSRFQDSLTRQAGESLRS